MNTFLIALIIIVALLLVLLIMVQNPKGGGLSSTFGGGGATMGGVQSTNTFLDKSTWVLVASMTVLIIMTNIILKPKRENAKSGLKGTIENREVRDTPADVDTPATPATPEGDSEKTE
jgi:preprotein translocase subunit SecG